MFSSLGTTTRASFCVSGSKLHASAGVEGPDFTPFTAWCLQVPKKEKRSADTPKLGGILRLVRCYRTHVFGKHLLAIPIHFKPFPYDFWNEIKWGWVKTLVPSEPQNSWQMDVHPPKNGINRFWPISKSDPHFPITTFFKPRHRHGQFVALRFGVVQCIHDLRLREPPPKHGE